MKIKCLIIIICLSINYQLFSQGTIKPDKIQIGNLSQMPSGPILDGPIQIVTSGNESYGAINIKNPLGNKSTGITLFNNNDLELSIAIGGQYRHDWEKNTTMLISGTQANTTGQEIDKFLIGNRDNHAPIIFIQNNEEVFRIDEKGNVILSQFNTGIVMRSPNGQMWKGTIDNSGNLSFSKYNTTAVTSISKKVDSFKLNQNYPNPFNPRTKISYHLANAGLVNLEIYNNLGQRVRILVNAYKLPGEFDTEWDGCDDAGQKVTTGTYFLKLSIDGKFQTRKMLLMQ